MAAILAIHSSIIAYQINPNIRAVRAHIYIRVYNLFFLIVIENPSETRRPANPPPQRLSRTPRPHRA